MLTGLATAPFPIAYGQTEEPEAPPTEPSASETEAEGVAYTVGFEGEMEPELQEKLEQVSTLMALRDRPPRTVASLRRRIARDEERLDEVLRAEGFYSATIDAAIDETTSPVEVTLRVDTGVVYLLEQYDIRYTGPPARPAADFPREPEDVGLRLGMRARSAEIRRAARDIIDRLGEIGRPLASITDEKIIVDHDRTTMRVTLDIDPGPHSVFGPVAFTGLDEVSQAYVGRLVTWQEGEDYDQRQVDAFRARLVGTNLFDGVAVDHAAETGPGGALPIEVKVDERKHRSIGAGATLSSDEGLAVNVFWEHRNLFGENERFRLTGRAGLIEQSATADFIKPNFGTFGQNLLLNSLIRRQQDDAFDEKIFSVFAGLERDLLDNWRVRAGPSFDYSILTDNEGERNVELLGFPMSATRDDTDDLLNATRGTRLTLALTPYAGAIEESIHFARAEVRGEAFLSVDADDRIVLAGRTRLGSIFGEETEIIPANKRFYAGGGGSVRGYPFRSLGPLDLENDPLGGRSVFEMGFETRFRVTENIGVVPFVEGGTVFDDVLPSGLGDLRWAAGLGLRYFTAIGPLRLDVAVPLDRRSEVDDSFEIYLSIGQAF